jgi:hypothetical protein
MTGSQAPEEQPPTGPEDDDNGSIAELSRATRMPAPQRFEDLVTDTIRRRSGGRFFGPKKFGDRVPFVFLAIVALVLGLIVFFGIRASDTGSLRYRKQSPKPPPPEVRQVMPRPYPRPDLVPAPGTETSP